MLFQTKYTSLGLKPWLLISEISNVSIWPNKCNLYYLELSYIFVGLESLWFILEMSKTNLSFIFIKALVILPSIISIWLNLLSFILRCMYYLNLCGFLNMWIAQLSTHILILLSSLGTNKAGTTHGLNDFLTNPLEISSSTCLWISIVSFRFIL